MLSPCTHVEERHRSHGCGTMSTPLSHGRKGRSSQSCGPTRPKTIERELYARGRIGSVEEDLLLQPRPQLALLSVTVGLRARAMVAGRPPACAAGAGARQGDGACRAGWSGTNAPSSPPAYSAADRGRR